MPGPWEPIDPPLPGPLHAAPDLRFLLPSSVEVVFPVECPSDAQGWCEHRRFRKFRVWYSEARRDPMPPFAPAGPIVAVASTYLIGCDGSDVSTPSPVRVANASGDGLQGLPTAIAESYYGWRVAGGDDRYEGIVAYPIDAHDDTLIFTYRDGEASVRVAPVPHGKAMESTLMHASGNNCERELLMMYRRPNASGTRTEYVTRPVYADGTLGTVCRVGYDDPMSSCDSCDPGCCDGSSGA